MPIRKIVSDSNLKFRENASPNESSSIPRRPYFLHGQVDVDAVEESSLHVDLKRRKRSIVVWASLNVIAVLLAIVDSLQTPTDRFLLWRSCQIALVVICSLNVLYYCYAFVAVRSQSTKQKIRLTSQFTTTTAPSSKSNKKPDYVRFTPYDSEASTSYWKDFQTIFDSFKRMTARNRLAFFPNESIRVDTFGNSPVVDTTFTTSRNVVTDGRSLFSETLSKYKGRIIATGRDLKKYLIDRRLAEEFEFVKSSEDSNLYHDSLEFWTGRRRNLSDNCLDVSPLLRRSEYQISPNTSDNNLSSSKETVMTNQEFFTLLSTNYKIDSSSFIYWISNFRMWLSKTVLTRIVAEMNVVDNGLRSLHLNGITIGAVNLDILEDAVRNPNIAHQLPSLSFLLPFLRVSTRQNYVVERFRILALGHGMGDYKWNGGGNFGGKPWERGCPTDAELIMHLFATYLDQHLPMSPSRIDTSKPFSANYLFESREAVGDGRKKLAVFRQSTNPPHYNLFVDGEVQEIPPGRNNLFYAIVLFLYLIKAYERGMLDRVSLGKHGIDMLWIIDDKD